MSETQVRGQFTQESKLEVIRQVKAGQSVMVKAWGFAKTGCLTAARSRRPLRTAIRRLDGQPEQ